jgi:hypothetical protein
LDVKLHLRVAGSRSPVSGECDDFVDVFVLALVVRKGVRDQSKLIFLVLKPSTSKMNRKCFLLSLTKFRSIILLVLLPFSITCFLLITLKIHVLIKTVLDVFT